MAKRINKKLHEQKTKDEIKGTQLINFLTQVGLTGKYNGFDVDPNRVAAARAALPFLRPTLASVEQTNLNPQDQITEAQLFNNLATILQANPDLLPKLIAMQSKQEETHTSSTVLQ